MLKTLPIAALLASVAIPALAADAPVVTGKLGDDTYLMSADTHMTLYTFDKDAKGGPVTLLCRPKCSFMPPFVRMRRGFSSRVLSVGGVDCRSR